MNTKELHKTNQKNIEEIADRFLDLQRKLETADCGKSHNEIIKEIKQLFNSALKYNQWIEEQFKLFNKEITIIEEEKNNQKKRTRYYKLLYEKGMDLTSDHDIPRILEIALDTIIELTDAERGFITVLNDKNQYEFQVARAIDDREIKDPHSQVSRTILDQVLEYGSSIASGDIKEDSNFGEKSSVIRLNLKSVICSPSLKQKEKLS